MFSREFLGKTLPHCPYCPASADPLACISSLISCWVTLRCSRNNSGLLSFLRLCIPPNSLKNSFPDIPLFMACFFIATFRRASSSLYAALKVGLLSSLMPCAFFILCLWPSSCTLKETAPGGGIFTFPVP